MMKRMFVYISALLFVVGCGMGNEEATPANEQDAPGSKVVVIKTPSQSDSELDEFVDEEKAAEDEPSDSEVIVVSVEPKSKEIEEEAVVGQEVAIAEDESSDSEVVAVSVELKPTEVEETVVSEENGEIEGGEEIELVETTSAEQSEAAGETVASVKPAVCRGTLAQLKNSCEFMPEWLNNIQATGEDITISSSRHGVAVTWNNGVLENGTFVSGLWKNGTCKGGTMAFVIWDEGVWEEGCVWKNGLWNGGACQAEDCSHAIVLN